MGYYCTDIDERTINCWSDMAGYDYDFCVMDSQDLEKAMGIAETELRYYGCPEDSPEEDYYFSVGYWEVVSNALTENGIAAKLLEDRTWEDEHWPDIDTDNIDDDLLKYVVLGYLKEVAV